MFDTVLDPNSKFTFIVQRNYCYVKDFSSYPYINSSDFDMAGQFIAKKALESRDGYHFQQSINKVYVDDDPYEELQIVKSCKNWCKEETNSGNKYKASNKMDVDKELVISSKSSELNSERNTNGVIEILSEDISVDTNQLYHAESSSSESDNETTLKEQGLWCEQDVKAYLLSRFTSKAHKRLDKWQKKCQRNELNGKMIGRDVEFKLMGNELAPLFMVPQDDETREEYYINDSVVNIFFELLKKRSNKFSNAYINHYSFNSHLA
ncbi:hypothetical protein J1N35_012874, partial [Gossypium stocksii]